MVFQEKICKSFTFAKFLSHSLILTAAGVASFSASDISAQTQSQVYGDTLTRQTQTVFLRGDVNFTTYQSEAAQSNATATTTSLTVGGFAGEKRSLGVFMTANDQSIPFSLNDSSVKNSWRDLRMQARFGWVYPSIAVSMNESRIQRGGTEVADLYGTGYGAGLGVYAPLTQNLVLHADSLVIKPQTTRDSSRNNASVGMREEVDVGANINVIPLYLDLLCGYKYRRFSLSVGDNDYAEIQTEPYAGLQVGAYF